MEKDEIHAPTLAKNSIRDFFIDYFDFSSDYCNTILYPAEPEKCVKTGGRLYNE